MPNKVKQLAASSAPDASLSRGRVPPESFRCAPHHAGIYLMYDRDGHVLYVGKAKDLRKRLAHYFQASNQHRKTEQLVREVYELEWVLVETEHEALLLENNYIKQWLPKYNVLLRDDKAYPYLYCNTDHDFPTLTFYRGKPPSKGQAIGPFTHPQAARDVLEEVQYLFQLRQCSDHEFAKRQRPCLQHQLKRCSAPCVGIIDQATYRADVDSALQWLSGEDQALMADCEATMLALSKQHAFEQAAHYRDLIQKLRHAQRKQAIANPSGNADVFALVPCDDAWVFSVLWVRDGALSAHHHVVIPVAGVATAEERLASLMVQFYAGSIEPNLHYHQPTRTCYTSPELTDDAWDAVQTALPIRLRRKKRLSQHEKQWLALAVKNAEATWTRHLSQQPTALNTQAIADCLGLDTSPRCLAAMDISHSQGEATYASWVVWGPGGAMKDRYRTVRCHPKAKGDDMAAIQEAITRMGKRILAGKEPCPDVLLVDGGLLQRQAAMEALHTVGLPINTVLGMAKGRHRTVGYERLVTEDGQELQLPPHDPALRALQKVRDEAHRVALRAHRKARRQQRHTSVLETIRGVGPKKRQALLHAFGGLQALREASVHDLMAVSGVHETLAKSIVEALRKS